ncbi:major facilitator superfamily domain-containing protein [Xylariomycetidae sp. FL2044]|nr:major facilitator superfamily domain-containing protein [Xylariomycetidae sp. FL2044]
MSPTEEHRMSELSYEDEPFLESDGRLSGGREKTDEGAKSWRWDIVIICSAMVFLTLVGQNTMGPAKAKIMEENICRELHPDIDIAADAALDDSVCRGPEVQGKIAMLNGWTLAIECIPGLLLAIPYGAAADRFGRKPILRLAYLGFILTLVWIIMVLALPNVLPIDLYLLNPIFLFIGGGLIEPVFYTIGADIVPASKMSVVYLQLGAVFHAGELVGAQAGGYLTDRDPWTAMLLGFGVSVLGAMGVFILPETLHLRGVEGSQKGHPLRNTGHDPTAKIELKGKGALGEGMALMKDQIREAVSFLRGNSHLMFLLLALVFSIAGRYIQNLLMQYAAERYGMTWGKASALVSSRSVFVILWQIAVLPLASWALTAKIHLESVLKDVWLGRVAALGLVVGALLVAAATSPAMLVFSLVVLAFGFSFPYIARSILNALVEPDLRGTLNATIGLCDNVGIMLFSPILSALLKRGIELGGSWVGLPFLFAACMFTVSALIIWLFRLRPGHYEVVGHVSP